jgi:hypothetical protein
MSARYESFYHFHIGKTGGTYLYNTLVEPLFEALWANGIFTLNGSYHVGWLNRPKNYILSSFRDPVKRTVSHYAFYKMGGGRRNSRPTNLPDFMTWVNTYPELLADHQSKNFLYAKKNYTLNSFNPLEMIDPDFLRIIIDKKTVLARVSEVNVLLRDNQLNNVTCEAALAKISLDFNLEFPPKITPIKKKSQYRITDESYQIYQSLTEQEKKYLYELSPLDSEIYFSPWLFFNNGRSNPNQLDAEVVL